MIIEKFVKNEVRLNLLRQGLQLLEESGVYGALLDNGATYVHVKMGPVEGIDKAAMRYCVHEGYVAALMHLQNFFELYVKEEVKAPRPEYGAKEALLLDGDMTEEEYAKHKHS